MSKLLQVSNSKYRAVISEMLPYERPVFFTNRYFARFLKYYGIISRDGKLAATRHTDIPGLDLFLDILGGIEKAERPCFQYLITKDEHDEGRCLTVIHPYYQVKMLEFYERYKTLILDFCHRSNYSIRFPHKIATYQTRQKGFHKILSDDALAIDTTESIKHFFAYKHYKNINFFYGDYRFLRAEKKFRKMWKIDLCHCFEHIDPLSLSFALFDHDMEECEGSFAYDFYKLCSSFGNKNNGIVIGPEFSRIYAELILQRIDRNIEEDLKAMDLIMNRDYIFYRYVDDGFLYYDDEATKEVFINLYDRRLKEYNQERNEKKKIEFEKRPFLEDLTTAKRNLTQLVNTSFQNRLETFKGFVKMQDNLIDTPTHIDFKHFINEVRSIMKSCGKDIDYKDITSFLLGLIQKHTMKLLSAFNNLYGQYYRAAFYGEINDTGKKIKEKYEREFLDFCLNHIEIMFYLLACDPRMSTSIKIVSIINKLQMFVRGYYDIDETTKSAKFPKTTIDAIDEKISSEIKTIFINSRPSMSNLMEILNILEVEKIMSPRNQIRPIVINDFIKRNPKISSHLNFFTVFELIHFIKDKSGYEELEEKMYEWIGEKIESLKDRHKSDTEAVLTFMEVMSCPWVDDDKKQLFAQTLFGEKAKDVHNFARKQKDLFIQWRNYSVNEAVMHINSSEVY